METEGGGEGQQGQQVKAPVTQLLYLISELYVRESQFLQEVL